MCLMRWTETQEIWILFPALSQTIYVPLSKPLLLLVPRLPLVWGAIVFFSVHPLLTLSLLDWNLFGKVDSTRWPQSRRSHC